MNELEKNFLEHHGIKGQKWGVRRFQNPDGSLTSKGKRRFRKLLEVDEQYNSAVKESTKAANEEYRYVKKSGRLKLGGDYKRVMQELYKDDDKFKPIVDKRYETWKKARDLGEKHTREMAKVAKSSYGLFTNTGWDRTRQILKDYGDYKVSRIKADTWTDPDGNTWKSSNGFTEEHKQKMREYEKSRKVNK